MVLPSNISYGTVVGQFIAAVADSSDLDIDPDSVAMSGTVTFIASPGYVLDYSAIPNPVTIVKTAIVCRLDSSGYLCSPYPDDNSVRGVRLVATDDTDLQPNGWTWNVMYAITDPSGNRIAMPSQSIAVTTNGTVDLTSAMPLASANGVIITKGDKGVPGDMVAVNGPTSKTGAVSLTDSDFPTTQLWTLTGNITITLPTPWSGQSGTITIVTTQDAIGGRTITWPTGVKWPEGIAQQPATGINTVSIIHLLWAGTQWLGLLGGKSFA